MPRLLCMCFLLLAASSLWSQVEPSATGGGLNDTQMMTPPPVSGDAYPVVVGAETRSNFLSGGMVFTTAYQDNLLVGNSKMSDETYAFLPTISLERVTPHQGESLNYSSGFTLYQHSNQFNGVTQNAAGSYRFHLSPYTVFVVRDAFSQNYNLYNQGNPFVGGGASGAPESPNAVLVAPFANQLSNSTNAGIEYQYSRTAMIGGSASYSFLKYSNLSQVQGLDNSNTTGATGFYSRRISRSQYAGVTYQFAKIDTHPFDTYTLTHTVFGFYTIYLTRIFSLSVLGGPEHYTSWNPAAPKDGTWSPAVQGSFGWRTARSNVVASYSHIVSGAGGLIGTYHADTSTLYATLMISRKWTAGASTSYSEFKNVNTGPIVSEFGAGGRTLVSAATLQRRVTERLNLEAGYAHFHQSYVSIPVAASVPDSNRVYMAISYQFYRPLGR